MKKKPEFSCFFLLLLVLTLAMQGCKAKVETVISDEMLQNGGEFWELFFIDGNQAGFQRTALANVEFDGKPVRHFLRQSRLLVLRYGKQVDIAMKIDSYSDSEGVFLSCNVEIGGGGEAFETKYLVEENRLIVAGASNRTEQPWTPNTAGPEAILRDLLAKPMEIGEQRRISFFEPALQRRVETTLQGGRIEAVDIDGKTRNLLRINVRTHMDGAAADQIQTETLWTDAGGNILRRECPIGENQTLLSVRTDREKAVAAMDAQPTAELGNLGVLPLNRSIPRAREVRNVEFHVQTKYGKPSDRIPVTPFQNVELSKDGRTAKVSVWSAVGETPSVPGNTAWGGQPVEARPEDLASGRLIDLDDPKLRELAQSVDSASLSPWQTALALERLVHETIKNTEFSMAFASSSEVLRTRSGDCTEFAVLLAALCRAKKIPARVTLGLVYVPLAASKTPEDGFAEAGMAFHLWNEVLIDGIWRPLDATLALGGADAARIKIADDSLAEDTPVPLAASVLESLGYLRISVAE